MRWGGVEGSFFFVEREGWGGGNEKGEREKDQRKTRKNSQHLHQSTVGKEHGYLRRAWAFWIVYTTPLTCFEFSVWGLELRD